MPKSLTMTPKDILAYQCELVRTSNYLPLGRMQKIAIGPSGDYTPPAGDLYIQKYGRLIDLRNSFLPIAHSPDKSMILVTAPLLDRDGYVALPDLPDPSWIPAPPSKEEIEGREVIDTANGTKRRESYTDFDRVKPRMIPQRLEDRTSIRLEGSNFLVFAPVERITFQPEIDNRTVGTAWWIDCKANPADKTMATLLVDQKTGQVHFFGGRYSIEAPSGS
jgi:hypothetical protein